MLHCIQIFSNTSEVTTQVKRAIGKATQATNILQIHVLVLSFHIIWHDFLFSNCNEALLHGFDLYI